MRRMFLFMLIVGLLVAPNLADAALSMADDDLLLYLPFNGDIDDFSNKGNHGEIVGDAEFVEGNHGEAMRFEEAGEVKCPYIEINDKSFTVCMWVMPALTGANEQCVFSQTQVNAQNTSLHYRVYNNGTVRMGFYSNDLDSPGAIQADEWAHICFWLNVDEESRKIYINGEETVQDAGKAGIAYKGNSGDTMIGSWGNTGQKFNGVIDEVQIWDRALTEDEILQSMENLVVSTAVDASGKLTATWGSVKSSH